MTDTYESELVVQPPELAEVDHVLHVALTWADAEYLAVVSLDWRHRRVYYRGTQASDLTEMAVNTLAAQGLVTPIALWSNAALVIPTETGIARLAEWNESVMGGVV